VSDTLTGALSEALSTGACIECGTTQSCEHRVLVAPAAGSGLKFTRMYTPAARCASCGRAAESRFITADSRGALVLFETADGSSAWFHRVCAVALAPADTLPPIYHFPPTLLAETGPRELRKKSWAYNRIRKRQAVLESSK